MLSSYNVNGLMFFTEKHIKIRNVIANTLISRINNQLKEQNKAFEMVQVEATLLTSHYEIENVYQIKESEIAKGSYAMARELLNNHKSNKYRLPLVVYQHGKSFRHEQDQVTKYMRLKEFYQLEFQILYFSDTKNDYSVELIKEIMIVLSFFTGEIISAFSDNLSIYAEWTQDIILKKNNMKLCSISKRKDFEGMSVLELAIDTDKCTYNASELLTIKRKNS